MRDIIDLQKSDIWKILLTILLMHWRSDNIEFMSYDNASEVVNELFKSLPSTYQVGLEISMRRSDFIFESVQLM